MNPDQQSTLSHISALQNPLQVHCIERFMSHLLCRVQSHQSGQSGLQISFMHLLILPDNRLSICRAREEAGERCSHQPDLLGNTTQQMRDALRQAASPTHAGSSRSCSPRVEGSKGGGSGAAVIDALSATEEAKPHLWVLQHVAPGHSEAQFWVP